MRKDCSTPPTTAEIPKSKGDKNIMRLSAATAAVFSEEKPGVTIGTICLIKMAPKAQMISKLTKVVVKKALVSRQASASPSWLLLRVATKTGINPAYKAPTISKL